MFGFLCFFFQITLLQAKEAVSEETFAFLHLSVSLPSRSATRILTFPNDLCRPFSSSIFRHFAGFLSRFSLWPGSSAKAWCVSVRSRPACISGFHVCAVIHQCLSSAVDAISWRPAGTELKFKHLILRQLKNIFLPNVKASEIAYL